MADLTVGGVPTECMNRTTELKDVIGRTCSHSGLNTWLNNWPAVVAEGNSQTPTPLQ